MPTLKPAADYPQNGVSKPDVRDVRGSHISGVIKIRRYLMKTIMIAGKRTLSEIEEKIY